MHFDYIPRGVCASKISFDLNDGIITNLVFTGGCNGNLKAIAKLVNNKKAVDIIALLKGNTCGYKSTSCADQLALALTEAIKK